MPQVKKINSTFENFKLIKLIRCSFCTWCVLASRCFASFCFNRWACLSPSSSSTFASNNANEIYSNLDENNWYKHTQHDRYLDQIFPLIHEHWNTPLLPQVRTCERVFVDFASFFCSDFVCFPIDYRSCRRSFAGFCSFFVLFFFCEIFDLYTYQSIDHCRRWTTSSSVICPNWYRRCCTCCTAIVRSNAIRLRRYVEIMIVFKSLVICDFDSNSL